MASKEQRARRAAVKAIVKNAGKKKLTAKEIQGKLKDNGWKVDRRTVDRDLTAIAPKAKRKRGETNQIGTGKLTRSDVAPVARGEVSEAKQAKNLGVAKSTVHRTKVRLFGPKRTKNYKEL